MNVKEISDKGHICTRTVRDRADALGLERHYSGEAGSPVRFFTPEEAALIVGFVGKKPGRKASDE